MIGPSSLWWPEAPDMVPATWAVPPKQCLAVIGEPPHLCWQAGVVSTHFWCAPLVEGVAAGTHVSPSVVYCFCEVVVCVPVLCFFGFWSNCEYYMPEDQKKVNYL